MVSITHAFLSFGIMGLVMCENEKEDTETVASQEPLRDVGVDLGTTFCCVSYYENGNVIVVPDAYGNTVTASYVYVESGKKENMLVGNLAYQQSLIDINRSFFEVKRLIGKTYAEAMKFKSKLKTTFELVDRKELEVGLHLVGDPKDVIYTPTLLSGLLVSSQIEIIEAKLNRKVESLVVTVPAYFNESQKSATQVAASLSKRKILRIVSEPVAAAMSYCYSTFGSATSDVPKNVLVYDLGGGTFDLSLLTTDNSLFDVKSTGGDMYLGGVDFTNALVDEIISRLRTESKDSGMIPKSAVQLRAEIKVAAEELKRKLSRVDSEVFRMTIEGKEYALTVTRADFERINEERFARTIKHIENVFKKQTSDAEGIRIDKKDIDYCIMVGGSTRIPKVKELLDEYFKGTKAKVIKLHDPDYEVSRGAALTAAMINKSLQSKMLVLDTIPLSFGIEIRGGIFSTMIERNSKIPTKRTQEFTTAEDGQTAVTINVFQGERKFVKDNHKIGSFDLTGIPRMERGRPKIEVTFEIDANGVLSVSATDVTNGKRRNSQKIVVTENESRLSSDEIDRMIKEAEKFEKQDTELKDKVDARMKLTNLISSIEGAMSKEEAAALTSDQRSKVEKALGEAKKWLDKNSKKDPSVSEIQAVYDKLMKETQFMHGKYEEPGAEEEEEKDSEEEEEDL